jgi:hypothetical protein
MLGQGILLQVLEGVHRFHRDDPGVREALLRVLRERSAEVGLELVAILDAGSPEAAGIGVGLGIVLRTIERGGGGGDLLTRAYEKDRARWQALLERVEADGG